MKIAVLSRVDINPKAGPAFKSAIKESLKQAGRIFANAGYHMTTDEGHVVTGRYRVSIGNEHSSDGIFRFIGDNVLEVGTNVFYSVTLEERYSILARSLDSAAPKIRTDVANTFIKVLNSM